MNNPTLKSFNSQKPFPFIQTQHPTHLFLHFSPIPQQPYKSLQQPQKLQFHILQPHPPQQPPNLLKI
ncbi:cold shock domain-containing protein [Staphylococcus pasteuri]|uniref:cold shock domain-containing protein n=1 Tax=Staphylococcus pasteuri TaxID=45972 RepID=UPI0036F1C32E